MRIALVDDHPLFRAGIRSILSQQPDLNVVAEAGDARQAYEIAESSHPEVMVVDLNLPGISGLELTRQLRRQYPSLGVVMLSIHEGDEHAFNALQAGAADYRSKDINPKDLADILRRVARGEYVINDVVEKPKVASRLLSQFRSLPIDYSSPEAEFSLFQPLSDREIEVLERIAAGGSNKEIADTLKISTQTVIMRLTSWNAAVLPTRKASSILLNSMA